MLTSAVTNIHIPAGLYSFICEWGTRDVFIPVSKLETICLKQLALPPRVGFEIYDEPDRITVGNTLIF